MNHLMWLHQLIYHKIERILTTLPHICISFYAKIIVKLIATSHAIYFLYICDAMLIGVVHRQTDFGELKLIILFLMVFQKKEKTDEHNDNH